MFFASCFYRLLRPRVTAASALFACFDVIAESGGNPGRINRRVIIPSICRAFLDRGASAILRRGRQRDRRQTLCFFWQRCGIFYAHYRTHHAICSLGSPGRILSDGSARRGTLIRLARRRLGRFARSMFQNMHLRALSACSEPGA